MQLDEASIISFNIKKTFLLKIVYLQKNSHIIDDWLNDFSQIEHNSDLKKAECGQHPRASSVSCPQGYPVS